ncbi:MAG TPA: hypothetical protein VMF13_22485, partial [Luteitalea sp.]|nr:hypothetical protein [Luteitalea sp.]
MTPHDEWREIGGRDALDAAFPQQPRHGGGWWQPLRKRAALGLAPTLAPAVLFVPIGMVLGPSATNVLAPSVLSALDAAVAVALAVLGVFVGLALDLRSTRDRRLFAAGAVEAAVTILIVAAAFLLLLRAWQMPLGLPAALVAMVLGLCAAASSAGGGDESSPIHAVAVRIADLDDVLPVVLSGVVITMLGSPGQIPVWLATGWLFRTLMLGIAIGTAGWLLFERAHSRAERNVFIAGTLALIGGTSAYLGLSPLLAGLMAGLLWVWLPGQADRVVREDLQRVQHPLIVVLLLVAGASCEFSRQAVWLSGPLILFRLTGKLAGGWIATRLHGVVSAGELGSYLIAPGLLGIAIALHLLQVLRTPGMTAILTAVVVATLASEALTLVLSPAASEA